MAKRRLIASRCRHPTCPRSTKDASGYCERHRLPPIHKRTTGNRTGGDRARRMVQQRFYASKAWREARAAQLRRQPECELQLPGCTVEATCVDHKVPVAAGGDPLAASNLQSSCRECHSSKTAKQDGGYGNRKTKDPHRER